MHDRIHIELLGAIDRLALVLQHNASRQICILISLHRTNFAKRAHKVPGRMHLLHDRSHCWGGLFILLFFMLDILRDTFLVLWLQLLVLQEIARHYPINLLEILQYCQSWLLFVSRHELTQMIIRINSYRCTSNIIKCLCGTRRWSCEIPVTMKCAEDWLIVTRGWSALQEVSLTQELTGMCCWLNLLVIIECCFPLRIH